MRIKINYTVLILILCFLLTGSFYQLSADESTTISYDQIASGIWKYVTDFDGTAISLSTDGYKIASDNTLAIRYNADGTAEDGSYDGTDFTVNNSVVTNCTWSVDGETLTFNYTWAADGKMYTDIYQVSLDENQKNAVCVLTSTTNPVKTSVVNKYVMYCVKQ